MKRATIAVLLSLPLWCATAAAAYWVIDFKGAQSDYVVRRDGAEIPIERLMLLHDADEITVIASDGAITIDGKTDSRRIVTASESPFVVPASSPPPGLIGNIRGWVESWWSTRGSQSATTTTAVAKGDLDPVLSHVTSDEVRLLAGVRDIYVSWRGGLGSFDVEVADSAGDNVAEVGDVADFEVVVPDVELRPGTYELRVSDGGSPAIARVVVVEKGQLPARAREILALQVPDEVRFGYLALYLSTDDAWRFEALQLARRYNLDALIDTLESDR